MDSPGRKLVVGELCVRGSIVDPLESGSIGNNHGDLERRRYSRTQREDPGHEAPLPRPDSSRTPALLMCVSPEPCTDPKGAS